MKTQNWYLSVTGMESGLSSDGENEKRSGQLLNIWQKFEEETHLQRQVLGQVQCCL